MSAAVSHNNHSGRNADAKGDNVHEEEGVGIIHPIEVESVRRIVAGQAVTDLASAVKELVDNALDANSQSINSAFTKKAFALPSVADFSLFVLFVLKTLILLSAESSLPQNLCLKKKNRSTPV